MDEGEDGDNGDEDDDGASKPDTRRAYIPGVDKLEEGEELDFDNSAYHMLHRMTVEWPCLSFDIIRDNLGDDRSKFPLTSYIVAGTQAPRPKDNCLLVMKWSDLHKTKNDDGSDSDDSDSDDSDVDDDAVVQTQRVAHRSAINRIRSMPQKPQIVSTWSENKDVDIWDLSEHATALDTPGKVVKGTTEPIKSFAGHPEEGFALDWSPTTAGRMLSGDCRKHIYLWEPRESGWTVDKSPFVGHTASVEDLQWSPVEPNVFASCSVDQTIKIWDSRKKKRPAVDVKAHDDDINVITWSSSVSYLLASGCDDGTFRVWDMRKWSGGSSGNKQALPSAHFKEHKGPITSIEWHPKDPSVLGVSSADDTVSVWDMSLEADPDAVAEHQRANPQPKLGQELPAQLLFIHQGQNDIKELHWHPQLSSCLVTTAASGFNIFRPSNM
eukprot:TRINITY_DN1878_c0_g1_i2.p1 TRINITY_DN1878_c0_g1~~TRINITY_DN1878_c0_g1_i2.p1  ORF type:complete len:438 (-),score=112.31 TRINITY_DN1878_c0_g1_i2:143-1456(-)